VGEKLWAELAGKQVLECGCGAGRFTEILLAEGAQVTFIDLSEAVDRFFATIIATQSLLTNFNGCGHCLIPMIL
jgi:2-polyprenyl-3-methyl-5-hydroxy-6-metoxy-1,4-benzoquinol methylase